MDKSSALHQGQEDAGRALHNTVMCTGKGQELRQELENLTTIFARLNLCVLHIKLISSDTLFTCCFFLCNYYNLNTQTVPLLLRFFLRRQEIEMGSEVPGGSHTFFLFVYLSWCSSSLSLWRHGENEGGIKKREVVIHLSPPIWLLETWERH